ncbi:hypothetical protein M7I_5812 [Glarea lozoyensis 74030]|nr:hypothetical protein M7I_5812 [Glarea lozoyensis 74030]
MAGPILVDRQEAMNRVKRQAKFAVIEIPEKEKTNLKLDELHIEIDVEGEENDFKVDGVPADSSQVSSMTKFAKPAPLHCPGSVPLPTTSSVFTTLSKSFPSMTRLPDGETGIRKNYIFFQLAVFSQCPWVVTPFELYEEQGVHEREEKTNDEEAKVDWSSQGAKKAIILNETGYAIAALASYEEFKKARDEGIIGERVKFQVSLPMPFEIPSFCILPEFQAEVEKLYAEKIAQDLRAIQSALPAENLAIQFDVPFAIAMLEGLVTPWFAKNRDDLKEQLGERFKKMAGLVKEGVEMGFHLCYGDYKHQHFMEPKDTAILVELNNLIQKFVERKINWVHLPVPKSRVDVKYFEPLKGMEVKGHGETEFYLGLVHANDCEGTKKRIETAAKVLGGRCFGVGTECGWGRHGDAEFESMLEVSKSAVSDVEGQKL